VRGDAEDGLSGRGDGLKVGWRWAAVACAVGAAMFAALDSDKPVQTMGMVLLMMLWVGCLVELVCEAVRDGRKRSEAKDKVE